MRSVSEWVERRNRFARNNHLILKTSSVLRMHDMRRRVVAKYLFSFVLIKSSRDFSSVRDINDDYYDDDDDDDDNLRTQIKVTR